MVTMGHCPVSVLGFRTILLRLKAFQVFLGPADLRAFRDLLGSRSGISMSGVQC